ncbi:MAG: SDR family NAD(P)-dependent oxidoreductase [Myxococcota bacterium]
MELTGNTILITGGSAGIGLAFAQKFAELGNEVIVTGRNPAKLEAAKAASPNITTIQSDAGNPNDIRALASQLQEQHPKLNVLFNNAGVMVHRNLGVSDDDLESLTSEVDINVSGPIRLVSAFIKQIKANKGTIINVSSGLAFVPLHSAPIYSATKAAIHSYSVSLRQQLGNHGVEVIELMPPAVRTEMLGEVPAEGGFQIMTTDELVNATIKGIQAGRKEIRPGQANQLHWMSRIAPGFINAQLEKGSKALIPPSELA